MNAKKEFLDHISKAKTRVKCANLEPDSYYKKFSPTSLPCNYTESQWMDFVNSLDFDYDDGYGSQELYGIIWYEDGTYSNRSEYDGSECWSYRKAPEIPEFLL